MSQTAEEFYTVRCQVADMKNIYVSLRPRLPPPPPLSASTEPLSSFCSGISGRGDHQRHPGGRQHVHLLPVRQEGASGEEVRADRWVRHTSARRRT